jgi:predicted AAA+ superfamily ATPase
MKNSKIEASFADRILIVKFLDNAVIDVADLQEIYTFGNARSEGKTYCIMFEADAHYEVTEAAISYLSNNPNNKNVLAKAYILSTKESEIKTKLHLRFDNPVLKPFTFKTSSEGKNYLKDIISKSNS